jgi:hypothetical protein
METIGLLDITIKYFNVIVFVLCVVFGMVSVFASWVAWREIIRKKNIVRSLVAAYNMTEDAMEKGQTPSGDLLLDPTVVQTVFDNLQEVLNAIYGEVTGNPMPSKEQRVHGSRRLAAILGTAKAVKKKLRSHGHDVDDVATALPPEDTDHHHYSSHP